MKKNCKMNRIPPVLRNTSRLLNKFSSSVIGRGKKGTGYSLLMKSLSTSRRDSLLDAGVSLSKAVSGVTTKEMKGVKHLSKIKKSHTNFSFYKSVNSLAFFGKSGERLANKKKNVRNYKKDGTSQGFQSEALKQVAKKSCSSAAFCKNCVENVKVVVETRKLRKGRATYQLPFITHNNRQLGRAIRYLLESARKKRKSYKNSFIESLAQQLRSSAKKQGDSIERRNNLHKVGRDNRAYAHFRWW